MTLDLEPILYSFMTLINIKGDENRTGIEWQYK